MCANAEHLPAVCHIKILTTLTCNKKNIRVEWDPTGGMNENINERESCL